MWERAASLLDSEWKEEVAKLHPIAPEIERCTQHAVFAAKKFNEIYIGGDDTSCMLQIIAASDEENCIGNVDILASVLIPSAEVSVAYTARGCEVYPLVCSFWTWSPKSPALLLANGIYHRLACKVDGCSWSAGYLCPSHIKMLQDSDDVSLRSSDSVVSIYVPGMPTSPQRVCQETTRAAIIRKDTALEDSDEEEGLPRRTLSCIELAKVE